MLRFLKKWFKKSEHQKSKQTDNQKKDRLREQLKEAVLHQDRETVQAVLEDADFAFAFELLETQMSKSMFDGIGTPLYEAVKLNHAALVNDLLQGMYHDEMGFPFLEYKDSEKETALHHAARQGNIDITRSLISYRSKLDVYNKHNRTPLYLAAEQGHLDVVESLMNAGACIESEDVFGVLPVEIAIKNHHLPVVQAFLRFAPELVDLTNKSGQTLLHQAVLSHDLKLVELLLDHDAEINVTDNLGRTPLDLSRDSDISAVLELAGAIFNQPCSSKSRRKI